MKRDKYFDMVEGGFLPLPLNAKFLAWTIFLLFFIENGTMGLLPKQFYFVYRNMRISDFLLYGLTVYSLLKVNEYRELFRSVSLLIPKLVLLYLLIQFTLSSIIYEYNFVETFFRLKGVWMCFMVFPYLLLLKRNALGYLIKLILPVAIVANILYIISAITGVALMPDTGVVEQSLPGGLKVFRVYGGTFYGEVFFLGFIYNWITKKFQLYQLFLVILFIIPHILAFGRSTWAYLSLAIVIMFIWYGLKKRQLRLAFRQIAIITILGGALVYAFMNFVPKSDYLVEAIGARVTQGQDDLKYNEGTYGTRMANITALLSLWQKGNILVGIGMHPLWVLGPVTVEESIYTWGFSDLGWISVLAAYGLIGFLLAVAFQIYYFVNAVRLSKISLHNDVLTFFVVMFMIRLFYDSVINYTYVGISIGLWGFPHLAFLVAALVYKYVYTNEEYKLNIRNSAKEGDPY
ncbi:MAG: hypothetical protein K8I03_02245 [Ignavibacteria bacterium]|nr:hypothetical protein [Ignavibacteria bacterium]